MVTLCHHAFFMKVQQVVLEFCYPAVLAQKLVCSLMCVWCMGGPLNDILKLLV